MKSLVAVIGVLVAVIGVSGNANAQDRKSVDVWSDGTRMAGDLWLPADIVADERRPAIVLAQGWGGLREQLNRSYALDFVAAGFVVLTFDYRGWGDSDGRLVVVGPRPAPAPDGTLTVRVFIMHSWASLYLSCFY